MAGIPTLRQARQMVKQALKERLPEKHAELTETGELQSFADLMAKSLLERIEQLDDPAPALRVRDSLIERAQAIREIRDAAIEQALADLLSTESLEAETTAPRPEA